MRITANKMCQSEISSDLQGQYPNTLFCRVVAIDRNQQLYLTKTYSTVRLLYREGRLHLIVFCQFGLWLNVKYAVNAHLLPCAPALVLSIQ